MTVGQTLGRMARERWPGGVLVEAPAFDHEKALSETTAALRSRPPAIFEAAFRWRGRDVRVDVLSLGEKGWELVEVKSSTKVKDEHLADVAFQAMVVEGSGVPLGCLWVALVDNQVERGADPITPERLFALEDVTVRIRSLLSDVLAFSEEAATVISAAEPPDIPPGPHCSSPTTCPFFDVCNLPAPVDALQLLPGVRTKKLAEWARLGLRSMLDVEHDVNRGSPQERAIAAVRFSRTEVHHSLSEKLGRLRFPACFIDFEAFSPLPPLYPGTRPYEAVPFQWSCHRLESPDGEALHSEFLADGVGDPRPAFVASLLTTMEGAGSLVHYSNYEVTQLKRLTEGGVPGANEALALFNRRGFDLLSVVKDTVYHPEFRGSFSIKKVLPALVPGLDYSDLAIQDGDTAAVRFVELTSPATTDERRATLRRELLGYCERDTLAMVELYRALLQLAG